MRVLFGDTDVTGFCDTVPASTDGKLKASSIGSSSIIFDIPERKFLVGNYTVQVIEYDGSPSSTDYSFSSTVAKGSFSAAGYTEIFQTTQSKTSANSQLNVSPERKDTLAQTFFTDGEDGGIFLSAIEVYFDKKSTTLPISCEIHTLENGKPSHAEVPHTNMVSTLQASSVNINGSPSKFTFSPPIHLAENTEYCFVLNSNSKDYSVKVAERGEKSIENSSISITEQPRVGNLLRTKDGVTWTEIPNEDIKFTLYKCKFNSSGKVTFAINTFPEVALGDQFRTIQGSKAITYRHPNAHGLQVNSKLKIIPCVKIGDLVTSPVYNGIPASEFNATHIVTSVIDDYTVTFGVSTAATKTGIISSAGGITSIRVVDGGSGYSVTDSVSITTSTGGSGAAASLKVYNGTIVGLTVAGTGAGYSSAPAVSVNSPGGGTGAILIATVSPAFTVYVNKPMTAIIPKIPIVNFNQTAATCSLDTTRNSYEDNLNQAYTTGSDVAIRPFIPVSNIGENLMILSKENESLSTNGVGKSTLLTVDLNSYNGNLSPVINLNMTPTIEAYSHTINSLSNEDPSSALTSSGVSTVTIIEAGSGYTSSPTVVFSLPEQAGGAQATATATVNNGAVTNIQITSPGSGYIKAPSVFISNGGGTGAAARAYTNTINSELNSFYGNAKSKYISKKISLSLPSRSIYLFSEISAEAEASVEWYARVSLSGTGISHESSSWRLLQCSKKSFTTTFQMYTFALENIDEFDTLDLKCVMRTKNPIKSPKVKSYKVITAL